MANGCISFRPAPSDPFPELVGLSPPMQRLKKEMILAGSDPDVGVLILGDTGTGKEVVARAIHRVSPRHGSPFIVINCAGLSATLADDELFGHVRGAYTGAIADRPGPFERAAGGTVFLDEVGDLSIDLQMKLLRVLQQRTVQRLGAQHEVDVDVRVVAATNVDINRAMSLERFRPDLYYRLKVFEISVPPLRERGAGDIGRLARWFGRRQGERRHVTGLEIDPEVIERFGVYAWPGNVRELEHAVERMVVAAGGRTRLTVDDLPDGFGATDCPAVVVRSRRPVPSHAEIVDALARRGGHRTRTAGDLGLSRHQLYRALRAHRRGG